ncbi:hypothetical protein DFH28DRAFT_883331 [Melampsora americana]|nr:hypothetical protein DFH28DRAFT_883331 [Melampsora americana]
MPVHSCLNKLASAEKTRAEKLLILDELGKKHGHTHAYFAAQWERQKRIQAEVIGDTNVQQLEAQIQELTEHEEELREAKYLISYLYREKMKYLRRRRRRSPAENRTLAGLPGHITFLEEEVERVLMELGGDMFKDIPDASGWDPTAEVLPMNLVAGSTSARMTKTVWKDCTNVLGSLHSGLFLDHARLIFRWDSHLLLLLHRTRGYCGATIPDDHALESKWREMLRRVIG